MRGRWLPCPLVASTCIPQAPPVRAARLKSVLSIHGRLASCECEVAPLVSLGLAYGIARFLARREGIRGLVEDTWARVSTGPLIHGSHF
jgi:hypothetical protein